MCVNLGNIGVFSTLQLMQMCIVLGGQITLTIFNLTVAYGFFCMDLVDMGQVLSLNQIPTGTFGAIGVITFASSMAFLSLFEEAGDAIMYCFFFDFDRKGAPPVN